MPLSRIVLGLTGGIAAYKAAELTRLFVKADIAVDVCMTAAACRFVDAADVAGAVRAAGPHRPVAIRVPTTGWATSTCRAAPMPIVVAPASADFLAKIANGHADDLLSTLASRATARCSSRRR